MIVTRYIPHAFFATTKIYIEDDKLTTKYKSLTREHTISWSYSDIDNTQTAEGKCGHPSWTAFGFVMLGLSFAIAYLTHGWPKARRAHPMALSVVFFVLAYLLFMLRLIKHPYIIFYDKRGDFVCSLRLDKHAEAIELIKSKIQTAGK